MIQDFLYQSFLKPLFFQLSPENAHHFAANCLQASQKIPFFYSSLRRMLDYSSPKLNQRICGIDFENPIGMAAGFDKTAELYPSLSMMGFGHVEVGTITAKEQPGNEPPRLFRFPDKSALVNRMGFNNPGADKAFETIRSQRKIAIRGINAGKSKVTSLEDAAKDYSYTLEKLLPFADYAVINVSSPNTPGLRSLQSTETLKALLQEIKKNLGEVFPVPFFLKFAPDLSEQDLTDNLDLCLEMNISGVILTNTTLDKSSLEKHEVPEGGLSGAPLFEKSLKFVRLAYRHTKGKLPIIGVGGIDSSSKAIQMIEAGASLLQIYTGYIYKGPFLPYQINQGLDKYLTKQGFSSISEMVGSKAGLS